VLVAGCATLKNEERENDSSIETLFFFFLLLFLSVAAASLSMDQTMAVCMDVERPSLYG